MGPVLVCFGTRPEVVKVAPIVAELRRRDVPALLVSTGQHREMLDQMLRAFGIEPDVDLGLMAGGQSLSALAARALAALDEVIAGAAPSVVVVQGDTTTAMAGALAAHHRQVPVAHVEAGLRSGDLENPFPEEGNRKVIGQLARFHLCPTEGAAANLRAEGADPAGVHVTGNTVIDAALDRMARLGRPPRPLRRRVLVTMHRRESQGEAQRGVCEAVAALAARGDVDVRFPVHLSPAVRESVVGRLSGVPNVHLCEPLGYDAFLRELSLAHVVLTDSGGVQEEAPAFDVPVVVLRETTERPEGVEAGCAVLVGTDPGRILEATTRLLDDPAAHAAMAAPANPYGDGRAAQRIVDVLLRAGDRPAVPLAA